MNVEKQEIKTVKDEDTGLKLVYTSGTSNPYRLTSEYLDLVFVFCKSDLEKLKEMIDAILE